MENLCRISKDLYNQSLYELRKKGEEEGVWLGHYDLRDHMKTVHNLEGNINYKLLRDAVADCVVKQVVKNVKSFFESIKKWKKHPEEFKAKPEFPHFLGRNGMNLLQIRYGHDCKIDKMGNITLNGMSDVKIPIPQWGKYADAISKGCKLVRILPDKGFMTIEVVYEAECHSANVTKERLAAIDFGIDNLATLVTPEGCTIFSG